MLKPTLSFFFFNDTATTEIYTLSLHDALPISVARLAHRGGPVPAQPARHAEDRSGLRDQKRPDRSEEHTSELQSQSNLVCRLLLEKKKKKIKNHLLIICGVVNCLLAWHLAVRT